MLNQQQQQPNVLGDAMFIVLSGNFTSISKNNMKLLCVILFLQCNGKKVVISM